MPTYRIVSNPVFRCEDNDGVPLVGGKVYTYLTGTSTEKATYADVNGTTTNANPIVLDSRGEATIYGTGSYKLVVTDADGNAITTVDPYTVMQITAFAQTLLDDTSATVARTTLGLGTAAVLDAGTAATNLVQLNEDARLPAVDGSLLTYLLLPRNYISGLTLSKTGDTQITVSAGECADSTNAARLTISSAIAKTVGETWAAGTAQNGIDTGDIEASTWYYVYAIYKSTDKTSDIIFTTDVASGPSLPTGYTLSRRIGCFKTNSSSVIIDFVQFEDKFLWKVPVLDVDSTVNTTAASYTLASVPSGISVEALITAYYKEGTQSSGDYYAYTYSPYLTDPTSAISETSAPLYNSASWGISGEWNQNVGLLSIKTNTTQQIKAVSNYEGTYRVSTNGWIDRRGQDD